MITTLQCHHSFLGLFLGLCAVAPVFLTPQAAQGSILGSPQDVNPGPTSHVRLSTQDISRYLNRLQELRQHHGYEACTLNFGHSPVQLNLSALPSAAEVLERIRQPSPDAVLEFRADSLSLDALREGIQAGGGSRQYHLTCVGAQ